ncbi:Vacuolar protein sorting-associated protein 52 [Microbotryomycetes sp. JL221]|nr:Vacuolar protein sorting-associated protein 52 [Microbotryomycetes sp. JL221]
MATVAELIGLGRPSKLDDGQQSSLASAYLATDPSLDPDDYALLANSARQLDVDIRTAYQQALDNQLDQDKRSDLYFLQRARQFVELNEQVETSASLLTDLAAFLATFQSDLSNVSTHISDLQGRSKTIEGRLEARRAVETSLHPFVESITISPDLINNIMDTDVNVNWISFIPELDLKLGSIRSGPRVESRRNLDNVAEALRLRATSRIVQFFVNELKPFTLSISTPLTQLHENLKPYQVLFNFLRRHSTRQAHDVQKNYTNTVRWYYETSFRRYVRLLEKIRIGGVKRGQLIGVVANQGVDSSLALLSKRSPALTNVNKIDSAATSAIECSRIDGKPIIHATTTFERDNRPTPEELFRSVSLALSDNARSEYQFLSEFFGSNHDTRGQMQVQSPSTALSSSSAITTTTPLKQTSSIPMMSPTAESESGKTSVTGSVMTRMTMTNNSTLSKDRSTSVVDMIWKTVMEPAQEYCLNFVTALVETTNMTELPNPTSLLSMIRLNETLTNLLVSSTTTTPKLEQTSQSKSLERQLLNGSCVPMQTYLSAIRMQLYPNFSKSINVEIDSLRKINGTTNSSTTSLFGTSTSSSSSFKHSMVQTIVKRYADMFQVFVELSDVADEDMVFSGLLRLRFEFDKLLQFQSLKINDLNKRNEFLKSHFDLVLNKIQNLNSRSSHSRVQSEVIKPHQSNLSSTSTTTDDRPTKRRRVSDLNTIETKRSKLLIDSVHHDDHDDHDDNTATITNSVTNSDHIPDRPSKQGNSKKLVPIQDIMSDNQAEWQKDIGQYLAIDCEMVGVGPDATESTLARVSIVNYHGYCILDRFVKPREKVTDYRTWVSGVREQDLVYAPSFSQVQKEVAELIKDRILIGHAISNDTQVLLLSHPWTMIRDTAKYAPLQGLARTKHPGLKTLARLCLGIDIQKGEHSSIIDAKATMAIYRTQKPNWESSLKIKTKPKLLTSTSKNLNEMNLKDINLFGFVSKRQQQQQQQDSFIQNQSSQSKRRVSSLGLVQTLRTVNASQIQDEQEQEQPEQEQQDQDYDNISNQTNFKTSSQQQEQNQDDLIVGFSLEQPSKSVHQQHVEIVTKAKNNNLTKGSHDNKKKNNQNKVRRGGNRNGTAVRTNVSVRDSEKRPKSKESWWEDE